MPTCQAIRQLQVDLTNSRNATRFGRPIQKRVLFFPIDLVLYLAVHAGASAAPWSFGAASRCEQWFGNPIPNFLSAGAELWDECLAGSHGQMVAQHTAVSDA